MSVRELSDFTLKVFMGFSRYNKSVLFSSSSVPVTTCVLSSLLHIKKMENSVKISL